MSYKKLDIWKIADEAVNEIHEMTINDLPDFEMYEEGRQIRKSSKSTKSNIVEGYGKRNYKNDFIRFLYYALASNYETIDHLETLYSTKSLTDQKKYLKVSEKLQVLGKKLTLFIKSVENSHISRK